MRVQIEIGAPSTTSSGFAFWEVRPTSRPTTRFRVRFHRILR